MQRFVEVCAGTAAVSLWLHGTKSPVSRIGSKAGYAEAIAEALGLERTPQQLTLIEKDSAVANAMRWLCNNPQALATYVGLLGDGGDNRTTEEVWRRCRGRAHGNTISNAAAWWLWTAGARGGVGGFKGAHKLRPNVDGFIPSRLSLIKRLSKFPKIPAWILSWDVRDAVIPPNSIVYLDPPYQGTTGYKHDLPRADVERLALEWRANGCKVGISEREPLHLPGARHVELTKKRKGQFRRSLTTSHVEWLTILDP